MVSTGNDLHMDVYSHLAELRMNTTPALEHVYAALNITSIVALSVLLATILLSKRLKRDLTLLNTFVVLIFVNFVSILYYLVRRGHPLDDPAHPNAGLEDAGGGADGILPNRGVCRAQACILAGSEAAQASAVFAMCLRLWISLMTLEHDFFFQLQHKAVLILLLALPYACIVGFIPPMVMATGRAPELLTPSPFYCSLETQALRAVYSKFALVFSALCLLLELHLIYLVLRRYRQTTAIVTPSPATPTLTSGAGQTTALVTLSPVRQTVSPIFILRVAVFLLWTLCMMMATMYQAFDDTTENPVSDLIFACVGILAFICFASQPDILRVWGSRRLARLWSARPARDRDRAASASAIIKQEEERIQGWSDFLGRDESDTALSARLRDTTQEVVGDEEEKAVDLPTPGPRDKDQEQDIEMDLFAALDRGPSR